MTPCRECTSIIHHLDNLSETKLLFIELLIKERRKLNTKLVELSQSLIDKDETNFEDLQNFILGRRIDPKA